MVKRLTIALSGTGSIGRRHIKSLQALVPDCRFVFLRDQARTDALSDDQDAQVVGDIDAFLATQPDLVIIATPSALHFPLLEAVIAANLPVYVEKPVVTKRTHVAKVRAALQTHSYTAPSLVGCNLRFLPSLEAMKRMVIGGQIGRPVRASFEAGQWLPDWRPGTDHRHSYSADPDMGGGVAWDLIHEMDAAHWMFGALSLRGAQLQTVPELEISASGVMVALLDNMADTIVSVSVDYVARHPLRRYTVVGTQGTAVWDLAQKQLTLATADHGPQPQPLAVDAFDTAATYPAAMGALIQAIATGGQTVNPITSGLDCCDVILDVLEGM